MKDFKKLPKMNTGGSVNSYSAEIAKQVPPKYSREFTAEENATTEKENARYREGKRQQNMDELKKTVNPFKRGGKVRKK
jgi:hypothetical protein